METDYRAALDMGPLNLTHNTWRIIIHCVLMLMQIGTVALAIGVDSKWSGLAVPISTFQAFVPRPKWPD